MPNRLIWAAALITCATFTESSGAVSRTVRWNVAELGAAADAATDDTAIFQKALDAAGKAGGGIVDVPAGRYCLRGALSVPQGVTLQGTYRVPPTVTRKDDPKPDGSVLLAFAGRGKSDGPAFIRLAGRNSAIAGLVVIYPQWKQTDVPPVPYPPCVESHDTENVGIADCCFLNAYDAIHLVRAARHLVRNVTGYPSHRGIFVDECYDIGHIENIHFWPFGVAYRADDPYCQWINTQGVAFELARTDWHYVSNTFCFGYGVGYKFSASEKGSTNGNFLGLGADSCRRAVLVEQAQAPGLLITNGEFVGRWESSDSVGVEVGPQVEGKVSLVNCSFWGPLDRCAWMRSPRGQATFSACHFVQWDNHEQGSPAIYLEAGKAIVQGCTFAQEGTNVLVGEGVRRPFSWATRATADSASTIGAHFLRGRGQRKESGGNFPRCEIALSNRCGRRRRRFFLSGWHGREPAAADTVAAGMRWSAAVSRLDLPVLANRPYRIAIRVSVPKQAVSPKAGLYLDGKRIAPILYGKSTIEAELPATAGGHICLRPAMPWLGAQGPLVRDRKTIASWASTSNEVAMNVPCRPTSQSSWQIPAGGTHCGNA